MLCTRKAENSGKCKHISAVLIWCTRKNVDELEPISKTDIKCAWVAQKYTTKENYKPVPVDEMPCFSQNIAQPTINLDKKKTFMEFITKLPHSALSLHSHGRSLLSTSVEFISENSHLASILMDNACQSIFMLELSTEPIDFQDICCMEL